MLNLLFVSYTNEKARRETQFEEAEHLAAQWARPSVQAEHFQQHANAAALVSDVGPIDNYQQENADDRSLLFRLRFAKKPTVYIDFGNGRDVEIRGIEYAMQNGLRVSYHNGLLNFHGTARQPASFYITGVQGAFRLKIERDVVDLNGTHIFTGIGLTVRHRMPQPERARYAITLVGGRDEEIGLRYRASRFIMKFDGDSIEVTPFAI